MWGRAYNTHLNDLHILENKIIRIIYGFLPRTNIEYLYNQQIILSVNRLQYYDVGIFMYKYTNSMLPEMFNKSFTKLQIHTHIVLVNPQENTYRQVSNIRRTLVGN